MVKQRANYIQKFQGNKELRSGPDSLKITWNNLLSRQGLKGRVDRRKGKKGSTTRKHGRGEAGREYIWTVGHCSPLLLAQKLPPSPTFSPSVHTPPNPKNIGHFSFQDISYSLWLRKIINRECPWSTSHCTLTAAKRKWLLSWIWRKRELAHLLA